MSGDFQIGDWSVQPAVNRLTRGDQVVRLEPKVMQVLVQLAEQSGEVVPREELIARVWPDVFVTDDVLHRAVRELRRAFGDSTAAPCYIETIRKRGYRLMISPTRDATAPAAAPRGLSPNPGSVPSSGDRPRERGQSPRTWQPPATWQFPTLAAAVALAVAAAVLIVATRSNDLAPDAHARFVPIISGPLNESDPALSPDGRRIAFVQREAGGTSSADIYIRDLAGGEATQVTQNPASDRKPVWSPDAARLAFIRETSNSCDIVLTTLAAQRETRVGPCGNREDPALTWTPDGRALLTSKAANDHDSSGWRIVRIDLATDTMMPLTSPPAGSVGDHSPVASPNGRYVAFIRRASGGVADVYVASADGSNVRRITFDEADLTGIDWSADGRSIVYSSDRAGGYSLWRVPVDGGASTLIAGGAARMKHPAADRTSRRVVYENWNYEINVWQAALTGSQQPNSSTRPITRTSELWNLYPQVSPDGARVAYVSTQSGSHELWIAGRDGSNARQLTHVRRGIVKSPRWSPDGRRILYLARGQGSMDVHCVDVATGSITNVTATTTNEVAPAWSHDGSRILFGAPDANGAWNVWSVAAGTVNPARLEITNAVAAQPSSDGRAVYYTRPDEPGVWRATTAGDETARRVIDGIARGDTLAWLVTDRGVYFVVERDDTVLLRLADLDGRHARDVATLSQLTWPGFSVSPDGSTVLYARWDRRDSNLMSIEY
jgi:Tol biopolymer transport system component/DNA-binding winged helix-turn-helix (wHTH) protein